MNEQTPQTRYRKDYTPPDYLIRRIDMQVNIADSATRIDSTLEIERNPEQPANRPLKLDGKNLKLLAVKIDDEPLAVSDYRQTDAGLEIATVPKKFRLTTSVEIDPDGNTALEGLYRSGDILCTQCEAEGFRRITFFSDRPDVMASYRCTIVADRKRYPVLLANGNPVDQGEDGDRHWVTWDDPHPKPSYLFALVAGDLACVEDSFTTASGREVALRFYVDHGNESRCDHALQSLKQALRWDEQVYGLEYDLDVYMVVAVAAFNMGAMENKGLNLFNDRFVLADGETATDEDYIHIEDVIAHEYFHNWTGNRVTLRDWFQLSLKESLTVFREQSFSADQGLAAIKRINDVRQLRRVQFPEDAGPLAHPVRPESYIEMNNFYTATVYEKGAEVIRMLSTLLGYQVFINGVQEYLRRFDGQAVTIEDFVATLEQVSGVDLQQFRLWYSQAGTPVLTVRDEYADNVYTLTIDQHIPPTPGQHDKQPMHIPLALGLLDADGRPLKPDIDGNADVRSETPTQVVAHLREPRTELRFRNLNRPPVPSLLRGFCAPVKLDTPYSEAQLRFLVRHDEDPFCRWEAGQQLLLRAALQAIKQLQAEQDADYDIGLGPTFAALLADPIDDHALAAEMLTLPGETYIAEQLDLIDPDAVVTAHNSLRRYLARSLGERPAELCVALGPAGPYQFNAAEVGRRMLQRLMLHYLAEIDTDALAQHCRRQFEQADNMTDTLIALSAINNVPGDTRESLFQAFEQRWRDNPLVMDKWLQLQATARRDDALEQVAGLMRHPAFDLRNPNRVRALLGAFAIDNLPGLHRADGSGYDFITDRVLELDRLNGQVAARLAGCLARWQRYEPGRRELMRDALERIQSRGNLSTNLYEVVNKSLAVD